MYVCICLLRIQRQMAKETSHIGKKDGFRVGTPIAWVCPTSSTFCISGNAQVHMWLGDPRLWGLCEVGRQFFHIAYFDGFVFLVKFPTAAKLIKTESCCIFIRRLVNHLLDPSREQESWSSNDE